MDPDLLLAAVLIGFGFGNVFLCTFISLSSTVGRGPLVGAAFIGGRFLGIMALGLFIVLFGWYVDINSRWMLLVFAVMSLVFGALVLAFPKGMARLRLLKRCEAGACEQCGPAQEKDGTHDCSTCSSSGCTASSLANDNENDGRIARYQGLSTMSVAFLGFVRGATPCLKLLLLAPLILTLPLHDSLAVTGVFALSSSIYSVIGITAGYMLGTGFSAKRLPQLRMAGAVMLIGIGIYFTYKFWTFACPGGI
ncbi:MAG: hypothetical protein JSW28_08110 [Thermoplasmata archaeon]|nr:MAG: hypothetical protein JSW28_08110 [Thermoplasmata archaeon]